jgi:hypothetical protein
MNKSLLILIIASFLGVKPSILVAQKPFFYSKNDSLSFELIDRHKKVNASNLTMAGFRIQIYFGSERAKAQELKSEFTNDHPLIPAYLIYQQPYFKVRVGDFKSRLEAVGFLRKIESDFTTTFIVPDEVKLPETE